MSSPNNPFSSSEQFNLLIEKIEAIDQKNPAVNIIFLNSIASLVFAEVIEKSCYQAYLKILFGDVEDCFDQKLRPAQIVQTLSNALITGKLLVADDIKRIYSYSAQNPFYYLVEEKSSLIEPIDIIRRQIGAYHIKMIDSFSLFQKAVSEYPFVTLMPEKSTSFNLVNPAPRIFSERRNRSFEPLSEPSFDQSIETSKGISLSLSSSAQSRGIPLSFKLPPKSNARELIMERLKIAYSYYQSRWYDFVNTNIITIQPQIFKILVGRVTDLTVVPHLVSGYKVGTIPFKDFVFDPSVPSALCHNADNSPVKSNLIRSMDYTEEEFTKSLAEVMSFDVVKLDFSKYSKIAKIIMEISNNDIVFYQILLFILANAMMGHVSKCIYTFCSNWNHSGKTTVENIFSTVLGSYCHWASPNIFRDSKTSYQADRKIACDKRLIIVDDAKDSTKDSQEEVKALTAGPKAKISCRGAYDSSICTYPIAFTLIKSTNTIFGASLREYHLKFPCAFVPYIYAEGCSKECLQNNSKEHQSKHQSTHININEDSQEYQSLLVKDRRGKITLKDYIVIRPKMNDDEFRSILENREELLRFIVIISYLAHLEVTENRLEKLKRLHAGEKTF